MSIDRLESFKFDVQGKPVAGISTPKGKRELSKISGVIGLKEGVVMLVEDVVRGSRRLKIPHIVDLGHTFSKE